MDAEDLYRLAPEDFTAARDAAAKQARADGDRELAAALKALRRPTVAAWLLNALVHSEPALVEQLLELGPGLAQAQAGGDAAALRALGEQRRQLVGAVVGRAIALADRPVAAGVRDEVAGTLEAGLADAASAQAVRSGRLVRALSYAGFGDVDLADAVAPASAARATPPARDARLEEAETAALEAAGRLDDAVRACQDAERAHAAADQAERDRAAEVHRLAQELAAAETEQQAASRAASAAAKAARKAAAKVERAQDRAERAREALDRLRRERA